MRTEKIPPGIERFSDRGESKRALKKKYFYDQNKMLLARSPKRDEGMGDEVVNAKEEKPFAVRQSADPGGIKI